MARRRKVTVPSVSGIRRLSRLSVTTARLLLTTYGGAERPARMFTGLHSTTRSPAPFNNYLPDSRSKI